MNVIEKEAHEHECCRDGGSCRGSRCMAWRWSEIGDEYGHCGLAGPVREDAADGIMESVETSVGAVATALEELAEAVSRDTTPDLEGLEKKLDDIVVAIGCVEGK